MNYLKHFSVKRYFPSDIEVKNVVVHVVTVRKSYSLSGYKSSWKLLKITYEEFNPSTYIEINTHFYIHSYTFLNHCSDCDYISVR